MSLARPLLPGDLWWCLASVALALAPHAGHLPPVLTLGFLASASWRMLGAYGRLPLPDRQHPLLWGLLQAIALATFALIFWRYQGQLGRDAGVALLGALAGLKLLELRNNRDYYVVCVLTYFLVVTNFFVSQEIPTALYLLLVTALATAAMVRVNAPPRLGGLRCARLGLTMVLESLPIMVVCFVLFPRLPGPLWGISSDASTGVTGLSDEMTIGRIAHLGTSSEVAFRVVFSDKAPPARDLYWRGPVLWYTDGRRWQAGAQAAGAPPPVAVHGRRVNYEILLEAHGGRWLPTLETVIYADGKSRPGRARELVATEEVKRRLRYRAESALDYSLTDLSAADRAAALALPVRAHPRTRELGRSWHDQGLAPRAIVQAALANYRAAPFTYTLTPRVLPNDPIDGFLFETKEGFCEHFAASFVVLMRAAGIPARVVTGYQGGEYNTISEYFLVRQSDAHAWAEVYLDGEGWVRVDPTAAVAPERVALGLNSGGGGAVLPGLNRDSAINGLWLNARQLLDSAAYHWSRYVLGYNAERQRGLLEALGMEDVTPARLVFWLASLVAVLLGLLALVLLRAGGGAPVPPEVRLYARFCHRLARIGLPRAAHEGPVEYAERVAATRRDLALEVRDIAQRFALLRYGGATGGLATLRERVRAFRPRSRPRD